MKKVVLVLGTLVVLFAFTALLVHAAGSYGTSGTRLYRWEDGATYDNLTGYLKQSGEFQQIALWWIGTTFVNDTLTDTVYTDWKDLGKPSGNVELYSLKVIPSIITVDTVGNWDDADTYTFALQTCLNPRTSDSLNISTIPVFVALTDVGTKTWFCPADSGLLNITYWTQYVRMQIIIDAVIDTVYGFAQGGYTQANYIPIEYDVYYKPAWR